MKSWIKIEALLHETSVDPSLWVEIFRKFGIESTCHGDSPPSLSGYIYELDPLASQLDLLKKDLILRGAKDVRYQVIPEEDWLESWKQYFKPQRIGQHWIVFPSWEKVIGEPGDRAIELDPGQAFGTGDHPTTRMCLALMEKIPIQGLEVVDIGAGSGILSVAACLMKAKKVQAVECDLPSVEACAENAERNCVQFESFHAKGYEPFSVDQSFDLVLSNIISAAIIDLAAESARRVRLGGYWLISGIIDLNWPDVLEALERVGFVLEEKIMEDEWIAAIFRR